MKTNEIREKFLNFFRERGHHISPSDSLIPSGDPSLLFTSAGMVQFKRHFLKQVQLDFTRAASCQKCIRTSDIDQVGLTKRHLTFFEMLGNFSFGDYFKSEAVAWAWEFLTKECGLGSKKLHASVYKEDDEACQIWKKFLPESKIVKLGEDSNFWNMGPTGPCGPCSEILVDTGEKQSPDHACQGPGCSCDRYLEVWNLVFTQFDRTSEGALVPLPQKNIDTGMGLERLSAVVNGLESNFETDSFKHLISEIRKTLNGNDIPLTTLRIISDHLRACTFLISDGILPSNEGRGYILRRLLRRALRQGWIRNKKEPFLCSLVPVVAEEMRSAYPEIAERQNNIRSVIETEEKNALSTIENGTRYLMDEIRKVDKKFTHQPKQNKPEKITLPGEKVFYIYDTFGLDKEIQKEMVEDLGGELIFSEEDYGKAKEKAVETARKGWRGSGEKEVTLYSEIQKRAGNTVFRGYEILELETKVVAILKIQTGGRALKETEELCENEEGEIVLQETPFYAESGGQSGDSGILEGRSKNEVLITVMDTQKPVGNLIVHSVKVRKGKVKVGDATRATVDSVVRRQIMRHHTATHLLHAALRKTVGSQVTQAGSLVSPEKLRFDFTYPKALEEEELKKIEWEVNAAICSNLPRNREEVPLEEARKRGALAFFGEKYGSKVFVLNYGEVSTEVCGGTHCNATGEIGFFKIIAESSVGSGIRRIEAVAGEKAVELVQQQAKIIDSISEKLRCTPEECPEKIDKIIQKQGDMEREIAAANKKSMGQKQSGLYEKARIFSLEGKPNHELKILSEQVEPMGAEMLRETADAVRDKLGSGIVLLAASEDEKVSFVVTLTKDCREKGFHAGRIAKEFSGKIGGNGGGKDSFAQGGGKKVADLQQILDSFPEQIAKSFSSKKT